MHKMKYTSNLLCYLDGSIGDKSRVFINNLSTFSEKDQNSFPWRRHCAVSGCGQRINVPSVKANVCWGFGSELRGGSCSGDCRGYTDCALQSTAAPQQLRSAPLSWKTKPKDGSTDGKMKARLLPAFLDDVELKFGCRETRRGKFRSWFLPQTLCLKMSSDIIWMGSAAGYFYNLVLGRFYWQILVPLYSYTAFLFLS